MPLLILRLCAREEGKNRCIYYAKIGSETTTNGIRGIPPYGYDNFDMLCSTNSQTFISKERQNFQLERLQEN
jgi:hypothetical protein